MKRVNILAVFLLSFFTGFSQHVTNVRAFEEEGMVMIMYDLFTVNSDREFYITLFASQDEGKTFNAIFGAKGDVDKNVKSGSDHTITWRPTETKNFVFKVVAGLQPGSVKTIDHATKTIDHPSGKVDFIKADRLTDAPKSVQFIFSLTNNRLKNSIFIPGNYLLVDSQGKIYRAAILNNRTSNFIEVAKGATGNFKLVVEDVPETITSFQKIEFIVSEIAVKFSDVKIGL